MNTMIIVWAVVFLGALAVIFGLVLAVASKVFEVKVDERLPLIQECLAGAIKSFCAKYQSLTIFSPYKSTP